MSRSPDEAPKPAPPPDEAAIRAFFARLADPTEHTHYQLRQLQLQRAARGAKDANDER